jgi:hypothetical protein
MHLNLDKEEERKCGQSEIFKSEVSRDAPDMRTAGRIARPFLIFGIRPDARSDLPDIWLDAGY